LTAIAADPGLAWCPKCEQECLPMRNGTCGFCDTAVEPLKAKPAPKPVRRRRRTGQPRRISDAELRKLHVLHTQAKRLSVLELSRRTYERFGYATYQTCSRAIYKGWKDLGLKARDRIEMTVEMSTIDGLSPRNWKDRRRLRLAAGLTCKGKQRHARCKAKTARGKRCTHASMADGYCWSHDPATAEERKRQCATMRAHSPISLAKYVPWAPVLAAIRAAHEHGYSWEEIGAAVGMAPATLRTYMVPSRAVQRCSVERATRIRAGLARLTEPLERAA
jgi:hypothetical protein